MRLFRYLILANLLALSLAVVGRAAGAEPAPPGAAAVAASPSQPAKPGAPPADPKLPGTDPKTAPGTPHKAPSKGAHSETGLSVEASLARATAFYEAGQYAQCADAFAALLDDVGQSASIAPRTREQASVYRAACLIALSRTDDADASFREAIRENPQMAVPNAIVFPPAVIERFIVVRTTLMEEIRRSEEERAYRAREAAFAARRKAEEEKIRVQRLEQLAGQETFVSQNQRWIAWVPFGVGQFQNHDVGLGALFLTTEVLLAGTAIGAASIELSLNAQAKGGAGLGGDVAQLNQNIHTANDVALIATGSLILVAAGGIWQANAAFVPEFPLGVRPRRKPKPFTSETSAVVVPVVGGAALSVFGRF
ncbi:MAG TPA: tetratricopeptide repeat protein [Polyangiaceae bacterium]|jgi:tetratricopeptide (TPR) repeat protein|nr:tetratricopeptide repeat protein [Polyangiaceae bacterium]